MNAMCEFKSSDVNNMHKKSKQAVSSQGKKIKMKTVRYDTKIRESVKLM